MSSPRRIAAAALGAWWLAACGGGRPAEPDHVRPDPPTFHTSPTSPSSVATPQVSGAAEAGATVRIFGNAGCTPPALATSTASRAGDFAVVVTVPANALTRLSATATDAAGNVSECAPGLDYLHDDRPPLPPDLQSIHPTPPSFVAAPLLQGYGEATVLIRVFGAQDCSGPVVASVTSNLDGHFELTAPATPNAATRFAATATDAAGNASACSNVLAYLHDDVAPAAPSGVAFTPPSPSSSTEPVLAGSVEAGADLLIFLTGDCTGVFSVSSGSTSFGFGVPVAPNETRTLSLAARDAALNRSACLGPLTYVNVTPP